MTEASSGHCLYAILYAPRERLEPLLLDSFAPILRDLGAARELESMFFVRYSEPDWQLRVRVLGVRDWIEGPVRARIAGVVESLELEGAIEGHEFAQYDREWERYGGVEGMALAERLFTIDSYAMLDLMDLERAGRLRKSRREWSLVLVERMLDEAGVTLEGKRAFYRRGFEWALGPEGWDAEDLAALDRKFEGLRPGLESLLLADAPPAREVLWGGSEAAGIGGRFLADAGPVLRTVLAGCASGRIPQNVTYLLWSYAHMLTNRLGIESTPEAILRYFMHRLHASRDPGGA